MSAAARRAQMAAYAIQGATLLALLAVWHLAAVKRWVSHLILPDLGSLVSSLGKILTNPSSYHHIRLTLYEFGMAITIALFSGILVGVLAGTMGYLGKLLDPILMALYAVPIVMFFPLCILFFGIGPASKIAFGALYAFFPIAIQTSKGLWHVDRNLVRAALAMGATRWGLLLKVSLPSALPMVLTGVRLGAVLGLLAVVAGEMLGALEGVGQQLIRTAEAFQSAEAFSWILITVAMVSLVGGALSWLERRVWASR